MKYGNTCLFTKDTATLKAPQKISAELYIYAEAKCVYTFAFIAKLFPAHKFKPFFK